MIPILYDSNETQFTTNGLGRLHDCISCIVTEERNGIYECDFEYPVNGANYNLIQCGRIIGVTHDDTGNIQPFDIVSYSKPLNGIVSFHAVHISYRQSGIVVSGTNITSLDAAFAMLDTDDNPFTYENDGNQSGYMAAADGVPKSVRQMLGGIEGSILDTYGGEYEWDGWVVRLHRQRGRLTDFKIRYGINLTEYNEDLDYSGSYNAAVPYWLGDNNELVKGDKVLSGLPSYNGHERCAPLDLSQKFESKPTKAQLEQMALSTMLSNATNTPGQSIKVDFIRLDKTGEYKELNQLMTCRLCDRVAVEFPQYGMSGTFKIVKTVYDVLLERFTEMELGTLSTTLSEALGIGSGSSSAGGGGGSSVLDFYPVGSYYETSDANFDPNTDFGGTWTLVSSKDAYIVEEGAGGTDNAWHYRKWSDGTSEAWVRIEKTLTGTSTAAPWTGNMYNMGTSNYPDGLFLSAPTGTISGSVGSGYCVVSYMQFYGNGISTTLTSNVTGSQNCVIRAYAVGRWSNTSDTYYRWHRTA